MSQYFLFHTALLITYRIGYLNAEEFIDMSRDGWQYNGDPLELPAMKFDAYQVSQKHSHGCQGQYRLLVGTVPSPSPR